MWNVKYLLLQTINRYTKGQSGMQDFKKKNAIFWLDVGGHAENFF